MKTKCSKHPKYKAQRKPKVPCRQCWEMWELSPHHSHKAFMCGVAWQHELGETDVKTYGSAKDCENDQGCTKTCGIVEVEIRLKKWVKKQKM